MIAIYLAPLYIALLVIQIIKKIKYFKKNYSKGITILYTIVSIVVLFGLTATIVLAFLMEQNPLKRTIVTIANYWFGASLYLFMSILIADIVKLIIKIIRKNKYNKALLSKIINIFVIIFTLSMSAYGAVNARNIQTTYYDIESKKQSGVDNLKVVLVSDIHLGYNFDSNQVRRMVNKINESNPDIVIFAGDIFDNEFEAIDDPIQIKTLLNSIKSKYGKYAIYGNHDVEQKIFCGFTVKKEAEAIASNEMNDLILGSGFEFLYDSHICIKDDDGETICYVVGRADSNKPNFGNTSRLSADELIKDLDTSKYIICADHEPKEMIELDSVGVDLDLNGHTHNGQMWPGTISINWIWDNAYGLKEYGNMIDIVSSGIGAFGPYMRIGCKAEIVEINIKFNN